MLAGHGFVTVDWGQSGHPSSTIFLHLFISFRALLPPFPVILFVVLALVLDLITIPFYFSSATKVKRCLGFCCWTEGDAEGRRPFFISQLKLL